MFVTVLYRMSGSPTVEANTGFTDVKAGQYYTEAVAWAEEVGITEGTSETTFSPGKDITRQELATMLYRYAKGSGRDVSKTEDLSTFQDAANVADWAKEDMGCGRGPAEGLPRQSAATKRRRHPRRSSRDFGALCWTLRGGTVNEAEK